MTWIKSVFTNIDAYRILYGIMSSSMTRFLFLDTQSQEKENHIMRVVVIEMKYGMHSVNDTFE